MNWLVLSGSVVLNESKDSAASTGERDFLSGGGIGVPVTPTTGERISFFIGI